MPVPRGARKGFIGLPGPRRRDQTRYGESEHDLAARYADAVRRHDEAAAELRQVTDEMAEAVGSASAARAEALPPDQPMDAGGAAEDEAPSARAVSAEADGATAEKATASRRRNADDTVEQDRPANLRAERHAETGSMCLTWDAVAREGLLFGVWRSVTRREGPPGAFERLAMVREAGFIDSEIPEDAVRVSYAVRAIEGRRPVPGSAHLSVQLDSAGAAGAD